MLFDQIAMNKRRTIYLIIAFILLLALIGMAVGYAFFRSAMIGFILALGIGLIYAVIMINQSINVVMQMNHGHEIKNKDDAPQLFDIVSDMALVARIPMPRIFIIDDDSPNAFATGNDPKHSAVAVTSGLLSILNREELEGVIGHEVSHIRNYDIRLSTIGIALSSAISLIIDIGYNSFFWGGSRDRDNNDDDNILAMIGSILVIILGPLATAIAQMALSRNREYLADASGVELTRNPMGLINALKKISKGEPMHDVNPDSADLYIDDPYKGKSKFSFTELFDTHPSIEKRINRLEKM
ncbi:protease HtpX [Philodulcilactobacillus myokoensis]|uniref:Protease HtpX homolog n=1 Tax=Philodulcilactobacillus myokoensis TaxID=2929573 RepID=A0A9W6B1S9_9LACO|nr:zinc metalloprotease HtpX [Philodulcilactobacillus myokoensis]GLB47216.1 protease HtpX [Philodulcilactobacillus myokoensis]